MKCPKCGADSSVLATRKHEHGTSVRTRLCFNEHRFQTVEIYRETYGSVRHRAAIYAKTIAGRIAIWRRNRDIARNASLGWRHYAEKLGLSKSSFYLILKAHKNK